MKTLETLLKDYLTNKAELTFRRLDIEEIEKRIAYHNLVYVEALHECIEGEALQAPTLSHIPPSITNKFNSKTENVAANYDPVHINRIDVMQLKIDKANIERQIAPLQREVDTVDALILCLNDKEKFVIEMHCIKDYTIPETVNMFASKFRYGSDSSIKEYRNKAIEKMERIYNKKSA